MSTSTDATVCAHCGGEFSRRRTVIDGKQYHERCAVVSSPAHTPEVLVALSTEVSHLAAALRPFALIGLDVLKEHPGWANHVFHGDWCGYRITYAEFEAAAAAILRLERRQAS